MKSTTLALLALPLSLAACLSDAPSIDEAAPGNADSDEPSDEARPFGLVHATCAPQMNRFPVGEASNVGYDGSCANGCPVSCGTEKANTDFGMKANGKLHNGNDVFARYRAPIVAVADGYVVSAKVASDTSGKAVKIKDLCGWHYWYGHLDSYVVSPGQMVHAGDVIGYMGSTGAASVHLHFNMSDSADYNGGVDPFAYLRATQPTACGGAGTPPPAPAPGPAGCGELAGGAVVTANQSVTSCNGAYALVMQGDGNLVVYGSGGVAGWNTRTFGTGFLLAMQTDGNLVIYAGPTAKWDAHTNGHPGAVAKLEDDGRVTIRSAAGAPLWSSR
jgi:hypothetical protein